MEQTPTSRQLSYAELESHYRMIYTRYAENRSHGTTACGDYDQGVLDLTMYNGYGRDMWDFPTTGTSYDQDVSDFGMTGASHDQKVPTSTAVPAGHYHHTAAFMGMPAEHNRHTLTSMAMPAPGNQEPTACMAMSAGHYPETPTFMPMPPAYDEETPPFMPTSIGHYPETPTFPAMPDTPDCDTLIECGVPPSGLRKTPRRHRNAKEMAVNRHKHTLEDDGSHRFLVHTVIYPPKEALRKGKVSRNFIAKRFHHLFHKNGLITSQGSQGIKIFCNTHNLSEGALEWLKGRPMAVLSLHIKDRQRVRCDEEHSGKLHETNGCESLACKQCPEDIYDLVEGQKSCHKMCTACIEQHSTALADRGDLLFLLRGGAWARMCDECMKTPVMEAWMPDDCETTTTTTPKMGRCTCQWEVPRCFKHRKEHLNTLSLIRRRSERKEQVPDRQCGRCRVQPATQQATTAFMCLVCAGRFDWPEHAPRNWLPESPPVCQAEDIAMMRLYMSGLEQREHQAALDLCDGESADADGESYVEGELEHTADFDMFSGDSPTPSPSNGSPCARRQLRMPRE